MARSSSSRSKNRLSALFETLNPKESIQFRKWLLAEGDANVQKLISLYDALPHSGDRKTLWQNAFRGQVFSDGHCRVLMHRLGEKLEDYIAYLEYKKDSLQRDRFLIKGLENRGDDDLFQAMLKKVKRKVSNIPFKEGSHYRMMQDIASIEQQIIVQRSSKLTPGKRLEPEMVRTFHGSWLLDLFSLGVVLSANEVSKNVPGVQLIHNLIEQDISVPGIPEPELLVLYKIQYRLYHEDTSDIRKKEDAFVQIKDFQSRNEKVPALQNCVASLINILLAGRGVESNTKLLLEVLEWGIEVGVVYDRHVSVNLMGLFIFIAIPFKNIEEIAHLIDTFVPLIEPKFRLESATFYRGLVKFLNGEHKAVMNIFDKGFSHPYYDRLSRHYILMSQFEVRDKKAPATIIRHERNILKNKATVFRSYIFRAEIPAQMKASYFVWVRAYKRLLRCRTKDDFQSLEAFIGDNAHIVEKKWLLEKCRLGG